MLAITKEELVVKIVVMHKVDIGEDFSRWPRDHNIIGDGQPFR